ncbi:GH25 family lysozyme [Falsibacillus albus]|uniref:Glycoside hydrolase n=1 Tax=Falsibacillus albus TaxID=2478915 RepID=A0A3L7JPM9_9BACI|nr:GH25 family lysozyme [Falsibacillus albus]RLQ91621.1 glycoside hydrolase [Falsibacillus albus]
MKGIDVSHWNDVQDWKKVKDDGIEFVYIKATEGIDFVDPKLSDYYNGAKEAGLLIGFYHFARPKDYQTTMKEAKNFIQHTKAFDADLPYVYDIEVSEGLSAQQITSLAQVWLKEVENKLGDVMIYSYSYFQKQYLLEDLTKYSLWIAHYDTPEPSFSRWKEYKCWQSSDKGSVSGINGQVDIDILKGGLDMAKKDYEGHWAQASIEKAIRSGIMKGHTDGHWGPDEPLTRAQLAIILDRLGLLK